MFPGQIPQMQPNPNQMIRDRAPTPYRTPVSTIEGTPYMEYPDSPEDYNNNQSSPSTIGTILPQYSIPNSCGTPILPSNTSIVFPPVVANAINVFKDRNQKREIRGSNQKIAENYLVERGSCDKLNPNILNNSRLRIFRLDDVALDKILSTEQSLNANIHDDLACAVDSIIYDGRLPGEYSPTQRERIRNWFPEVKQIGAESVEGYALKTSFSSQSNLFVMKAPRDPRNDELVHEALIGFYALNKLRHVLPNYMYVYGYTRCSPPALVNKEPITWCSSSNPAVSYLITENIRDAVPIGEFINSPNVTAIDVMAVLLQVFNALNRAYKQYGYTHYDLHHGNIMVRKFSKIVAIPYFGIQETVQGYIASAYVPYIIDYGYSRITVGGVGFGKIGLESYGIEGDSGFPMFDIYKIIGFLGEKNYFNSSSSVATQEIRKLLEILFSSFNEGSLYDRVKKRLGGNDWYSADIKYRNITHDDFLTWLSTKSNIKLPVHSDLLALMANGIYAAPINTPLDTCAFYNLISNDRGPETSLEYCEVVAAINQDTTMSPQIKQESIKWLDNHFNANEHFLDTLKTIYSDNQEIATLYQKRRIGNSMDIIPALSTSSNLFTQQFVVSYRDTIIDLLKIKDLYTEMTSFIRASTCSLSSQGTYQQNQVTIESIIKALSKWSDFINYQRKILKINLDFIKNSSWKSATSDKSVIKFWDSEHKILIFAV